MKPGMEGSDEGIRDKEEGEKEKVTWDQRPEMNRSVRLSGVNLQRGLQIFCTLCIKRTWMFFFPLVTLMQNRGKAQL